MSKDTSLTTDLTFAVLPVLLPINPRNGRIVKKAKQAQVIAEDDENTEEIEIEREIDPNKKYVVQEKLEIHILENNMTGTRNSSGYYLFLDLPQSKGYTLVMQSDTYLASKNFINMEEFDANRNIERNVSAHRSVVGCVFEKHLLKNTEKDSPFIKSMIVYPSKKTVLRATINKVNTGSFSNNYPEKPILEVELSLRKKISEGEDASPTNSLIAPDSVSINEFAFSSLDDIPGVNSVPGTYDEAVESFLGQRDFLNLPNQNDGKFELLIRLQQQIDGGSNTTQELTVELKIEKAMTTLINILIIE